MRKTVPFCSPFGAASRYAEGIDEHMYMMDRCKRRGVLTPSLPIDLRSDSLHSLVVGLNLVENHVT